MLKIVRVATEGVSLHMALIKFDLIALTICEYQQVSYINLLNAAGYVMHQQFNIQQLCALPTLYLCVLYLSENRQRLVPLTA